jgi:hypothetical protein
VLQASHDGAPLIIRLNSSAKEWAGHPALRIKMGFAVALKAPNEGGLPTSEESSQLQGIEDIIVQEVDARAKGIYALGLTTGVMKEFVFYIAPNADIAGIHQAIRSRVSSHDVQCMADMDPAWEAYLQFASE